jgi:hypothetical protein
MPELRQFEDELQVSESLHQRNDLEAGLARINQHLEDLQQGLVL